MNPVVVRYGQLDPAGALQLSNDVNAMRVGALRRALDALGVPYLPGDLRPALMDMVMEAEARR